MKKRILLFLLSACIISNLLVLEAFAYTSKNETHGTDYADGLLGERLENLFRSGISDCVSPSIPAVGGSMSTKGSYTITFVNQPGISRVDYQCLAYARAAYSYLFGYNVGDATYQTAFSSAKGKSTVDYEFFQQLGVRCGAYMRTTNKSSGDFNANVGHSLLILGYNSDSITTLEGNYNGRGAIGILQYTWEQFNKEQLSGRNRYICGFGQPSASIYDSVTSASAAADVDVKLGSYFTIKNLGSGKMLNVRGNSSKSNTNVTVYQSDGTTGQSFQFLDNGAGGYIIQPQCAASCALNVYGQYSAAGFNVNIWTKSGNSTQSWIIEYYSAQNGYIIRSADNTNYVLTAGGSENSSNVKLEQYDPSNAYQIWLSDAFSVRKVSVQLGSYFTIKNLGSDKMLNVKGNSNKSNTNVTIYQADGTTGQSFRFIDNGIGGYVIEPQCAPSCAVNVYGQHSSDGLNVNIWAKSGNSTQSWFIEYNRTLDGFIIRSADNKDFVLTAGGSGNSSNVQLGKYDPANTYQVWLSDALQY